jgi:RimJ/RimL family protein N-acetyltransferase
VSPPDVERAGADASLERLETARLLCLRPRAEHREDLEELLCDPRVARTLSASGEPPGAAEVSASLAASQGHWERYGFGFWMLYDRQTGGLLGRGGPKHTLATGIDEVEVGWAIVPERWGEGLATELALASVDVGFSRLGVPELISFTLVDNLASRRVMEKAGFAYERGFTHVGLSHVLYRRRRC